MRISELELLHLKKVANGLSKLVASQEEKSDCLSDFAFDQFSVETDEQETLKAVREHVELSIKSVKDAHDQIQLLIRHFES